MPYIYILECADGSYYTGSTTNLERRLWEHQNGQGANYTRNRLPVRLAYCDECDRLDDVFFREKQIQGWNRKKKQALITGDTNQLHRLAAYRNETHCRNVKISSRVIDLPERKILPGGASVPFDSAQRTENRACYPNVHTRSLSGVEETSTEPLLTQRTKPLAPLAIIALTIGGKKLAAQIGAKLQAVVLDPQGQGLAATMADAWPRYGGLILIMAAGIAVRTIAPLLASKRSDPGVVVLDEAGRFAVSLLSGHLGGGNHLAHLAAAATGGQAVITTASDTLGLTAIDLWARHNNLVIAQGSLTAASATLVNNGTITVFTDLQGTLPADFAPGAKIEEAELIISNRLPPKNRALAILCPKNLVMGVGCNRGTVMAEIEEAAMATCSQHRFCFQAVSQMASIDIKHDEPGLLQFASVHGLRQHWYNAEQLNSVPGITPSSAVLKATGALAVAEPAAMLAACTNTLLIRKTKWNNVTIALAETPVMLSVDSQLSAPDPAASNT